jgi:hypothetical protein
MKGLMSRIEGMSDNLAAGILPWTESQRCRFNGDGSGLRRETGRARRESRASAAQRFGIQRRAKRVRCNAGLDGSC